MTVISKFKPKPRVGLGRVLRRGVAGDGARLECDVHLYYFLRPLFSFSFPSFKYVLKSQKTGTLGCFELGLEGTCFGTTL